MMSRVRRDVIRVCVRQKNWRMALTVLFLPTGYSLQMTDEEMERRKALRRKAESNGH